MLAIFGAIEKKFGYAEFNWPADSDLRTFFEKCAEKSNDYWYNEGGDDSMYIDVAEVVAGVELDALDEYVVNYVFPTMTAGRFVRIIPANPKRRIVSKSCVVTDSVVHSINNG